MTRLARLAWMYECGAMSQAPQTWQLGNCAPGCLQRCQQRIASSLLAPHPGQAFDACHAVRNTHPTRPSSLPPACSLPACPPNCTGALQHCPHLAGRPLHIEVPVRAGRQLAVHLACNGNGPRSRGLVQWLQLRPWDQASQAVRRQLAVHLACTHTGAGGRSLGVSS